jgi:hypothetical protein
MKMKFDGGYVCKKCYAIVSRNFTETIVKKKYDELLSYYEDYKRNRTNLGEFEISKKIADLMLVDYKNKKICLPNNRRMYGSDSHPEIFGFSEIFKFELKENNKIIDINRFKSDKKIKDKNEIVNELEIIVFTDRIENIKKSIKILTSPVRKSSFAYRRSIEFATEIIGELDKALSS